MVEIDACPDVTFAMLDAEAVEDVGCVEACIVAELAGDDFERFGEGFDDGLLFVGHVSIGELVEVGGDFHLGGTAAGDDGLVAQGALDDHDCVVEGAFDFGDELFGAAAEDQGAGFCFRAVGEDVEAVGSDLAFFEEATGAEVGGVDVGAGGLDGGACGLADAFEIVGCDSPRAEDIAVGKELGG